MEEEQEESEEEDEEELPSNIIQEDENFSDFVETRETRAPVLESTPIEQAPPLEQQMQNIVTPESEKEQENIAYNEPDYAGTGTYEQNYNQAEARTFTPLNRDQVGLMAREEQVGMDRSRERSISQFQQGMTMERSLRSATPEPETQREYKIEAKKSKQKLPFEQ